MTPLLSIVTGTKDRPKSLHRLIDSVIRNTTVTWELVVGDADDPSPSLIHESVRFIKREGREREMIPGYNKLFKMARGQYVAQLNDDCAVLPGWDTNAIAFLEAHPDVGIAALSWCDNHRDDDTHKCKFKISTAWGIPYANFSLLRRELGDRVGWFDERLTSPYGCDNSLCCRVMKLGLGVVGVRDAKVVHYREMVEGLESRIENYSTQNNFTDLYMPDWEVYKHISSRFLHLQPLDIMDPPLPTEIYAKHGRKEIDMPKTVVKHVNVQEVPNRDYMNDVAFILGLPSDRPIQSVTMEFTPDHVPHVTIKRQMTIKEVEMMTGAQ